jgi:hypothetical protein
MSPGLYSCISMFLIQQGNHFIQAPNMIADPCLHGWGNAQGLMNPAEVVMHVMERNRMLQILKFL